MPRDRGRRRRARAAAGRRRAGASAARSAGRRRRPRADSPSSSSSSSSRLASTDGQRGAQLVRGVGDELALARERRLGLAARGVERAQHALERQRQLGDLVVGLGVRDPLRRVARALDRARRIGQPRDRRHRARRGRQAGEQRERGAAEHAEPEEDAHAVGRRLDVGELARVLDVEPVSRRAARSAATRRGSRRSPARSSRAAAGRARPSVCLSTSPSAVTIRITALFWLAA